MKNKTKKQVEIINNSNEKLLLSDVGNRRELLIAFMIWENRTHNIPMRIIERTVDKYLESN